MQSSLQISTSRRLSLRPAVNRLCAYSASHCQTKRVFTTASTSDLEGRRERAQRKLRMDWTNRREAFDEAMSLRSERDAALTGALHSEREEHHRSFARMRYIPSFPAQFPATDMSQVDGTPLVAEKVKTKHKRVGLLGEKMGMQTIFDNSGFALPVTVVRVDTNVVVQLKREQHERRGTFGMQVGMGSAKVRRQNWGKLGHFVKQGVAPKRWLKEFRVGRDGLLPVGTALDVRHFAVGQFVDVRGVSKGKGFQGVVKRWGFKGGPATHGSTKFHRKRGSHGGCEDPGKVWKGERMPGRMGGKNFWAFSRRVLRIDPEQGLLWIYGPLPGVPGKSGKMYIRDSHFHPPTSPPFPTFFAEENEEKPIQPLEFQNEDFRWYWHRDMNSESWSDHVHPDLP